MMLQQMKRWFPPIVTLALLLLAWEIGVIAAKIPPYILPAPSAVFSSLIQDGGSLYRALIVTLRICFSALALASRETSLGIMRQGEANGVGTALEVAQAEALRDSARADVAAYVTTQAQALNAARAAEPRGASARTTSRRHPAGGS